jgi:hypothetical protein
MKPGAILARQEPRLWRLGLDYCVPVIHLLWQKLIGIINQ